MSPALAAAVRAVGDRTWKRSGTEDDGTLRQWAEVDFESGAKSEHKASQPLRYVGLRLLKPQGVLFADFCAAPRLVARFTSTATWLYL